MSDILVARANELDRLGRPIGVSFAVHVAVLVTLAVLPASWFAGKAPEKLMVISLGAGAVGPDPNGLTAIGGKKVEEVAPPKSRPEPILPTAPKSTALTEPTKTVVKPPPPKTANAPAPPAVATKPTTGAEITQGNTVAATTAKGLGIGLSSGGQGGSSLDSNWCCPDWSNLLLSRINWTENLGLSGTVKLEFVVDRSGKVITWKFVQHSGIAQLDIDAQRALVYAQLPPLPEAYGPDRLTITLTFPYIR